MSKIIGIDLGTTNSCVAFYERGRADIIESAERERKTPTVVGQRDDGDIVTGAPARWQAQTNPEFTFGALKRILGRRIDDPVTVAHGQTVAYRLEAGPDGMAWVRTRAGLKSPAELLAHVLRKLRAAAGARFGAVVNECVLTVPAHFTPAQKAAAVDAVRQSGLAPVRLLHEPTAAAVAYGLSGGPDRTLAVFDFGGGTFDVSILRVRGREFKVLAVDGDPFLGGEDYDRRLVMHVADQFLVTHELDLRADKFQLQRLRDECEKAKIRLSAQQSYEMQLAYVAQRNNAKLDLVMTITQADLEAMTADLTLRVLAPCERAFEAANIRPHQIDDVVLVGGMTAMPAIAGAVRAIFGREPRQDVPPEEVVAIGAAMRAAAASGDIRSLNLREAVAHALGVETGDGGFQPIIRAGLKLPVRRRATFHPHAPGQTAAAVRIHEGDLEHAADNRPLGALILPDLTAGAADAAPLVEVTFELDTNGLLTATARCLPDGEPSIAQVHVDTGLPPGAMDDLNSVDEPEDEAA